MVGGYISILTVSDVASNACLTYAFRVVAGCLCLCEPIEVIILAPACFVTDDFIIVSVV